MASFLDKSGLSYFYNKIKAKLDKKLDKNLTTSNKYLKTNNSGQVSLVDLPDQSFKANLVNQLPATAQENQVFILPINSNNSIKHFIDIFYPIGSYYQTSNPLFDPNSEWSGTSWVEDSKGKVLVSLDNTITDFNMVNKTGGERAHTLTKDELPSHGHAITYGNFPIVDNNGNGTETKYGYTMTMTGNGTFKTNLSLNVGNNKPFNNMPPYIVIKRWHRIG